MEVTRLSSVVETVTDLVTPILQDHGFYLYDLEFVKEGKSWYLRVYIDKDGGITIEDCAIVSDELSEALDNVEPDPIPQAYFLEVSSPGAERPLKKEEDYQRAINHYIHVSLYQQINGQKVYEGTLTQLSEKEITLDYLDKTRHRQVSIDRNKIAQARLAIKF
ncbi:ribosome maturation factor RimP [Lactobacillus sp. 0.1XD8-4]|nr:ribosome maturation factor RimP [Lactobacillus sp. 0.1XD8-4]